ncbi:MAG TPA: choice-of-anchor U domain-containing protein [Candidatus Saccharimonadales bacterium]|nr:choice-of-anchor U domain-containing protein [Candidatus Saccharimonadales bacterium]
MRIATRLSNIALYSVIIAALVVAALPMAWQASAAPSRSEWNNLAAADPAARALIKDSGIRDTETYQNKLYVGGYQWPNNQGSAMLMAYSPNSGWQDALPPSLTGQDNKVVRALHVYDDKLYVGVENWDGPAELWVYNGTSWSLDPKFTLNNGRSTAYVDAIYDIAHSADGDLCATITDSSLSFSLAVACTDGSDPWEVLPQTGINTYEYSNQYNNDIAIQGNTIYIQTHGESDGDYYSRVWKYTLGSSSNWVQASLDGFGGNSYVRALGVVNEQVIATTIGTSDDVARVWRYNGTSTSWTQIGSNNLGTSAEIHSLDAVMEYDNQIVVAAHGYNDSHLRLLTWTGSDWTDIGPLPETIDQNAPIQVSYSAALAIYQDALILGGTNDGEGFFDSSVWASTTLFADEEDEEEAAGPDADNDGIGDSSEDAAPNNGDANNDGIVDSEQANVSSFVSPVSSKYVALAVPDACTITTAHLRAASANGAADSGFSYPLGMMDFSVSCGTPGYTATVTQYYYDATGSYIARKYKPSTKAYMTIPNAVIEKQTVAGATVTKVSYQVTDGGNLDDDGAQNGVIVDPAGLGINSVAAPNTGLGGLSAR